MVRDLLFELFPPGTPAIVRWRLAMAAFAGLVLLHIAWACGFLPGLQGFAMASDMERVESKLDLSLKLQVEGRLRALKQEKCLAATGPLIAALQTEIDRLQQEHKDLDGDYYPLPSCRDYVVEGVQGKVPQE